MHPGQAYKAQLVALMTSSPEHKNVCKEKIELMDKSIKSLAEQEVTLLNAQLMVDCVQESDKDQPIQKMFVGRGSC